ncbi:MAG: hypothetical protein K0V04_20005, partial [Deltaproteobacteria bacterium]|nr:hypothetical protein [Deltaproteobacteria bacterium]
MLVVLALAGFAPPQQSSPAKTSAKAPTKTSKKPSTKPHDSRRRVRGTNLRQVPAPQGVGLAVDASVMPSLRTPPVVGTAIKRPGAKPRKRPRGLRGWSQSLGNPRAVDRRRRQALTARPPDYGSTLAIGERFRFDVSFAGNPAGLAEAEIIAVEADPRGPPPAGAPMVR